MYMLKDKELRAEIILLHHDVLVAGHRERLSYAKSIHLENTSLQYIPCQQLKPTFHNMPCGSDVTIQVFCLL